jgi:hypothetical protein
LDLNEGWDFVDGHDEGMAKKGMTYIRSDESNSRLTIDLN